MAWSDQARAAALLVRQMRSKAKETTSSRVHYHTGNIEGRIVDVSRKGLARRIKRMRRGEIPPDQKILNVAHVSQNYRRKRGPAIASVRRAYRWTDEQMGRKR